MPSPCFYERYNYLIDNYSDPLDVLIFLRKELSRLENSIEENKSVIHEIQSYILENLGQYPQMNEDSEEFSEWYRMKGLQNAIQRLQFRTSYLTDLYGKLIHYYNSENVFDGNCKIDNSLQESFLYMCE